MSQILSMMHDGIKTVFAAINQHPRDNRATAFGFSALVLFTGMLRNMADAQIRVRRLGGIKLAINAMSTFPRDDKVFLGACALLRVLSHENREYSKEIGQSGAIPLIVGTM